jgi:hypothetical protein
VGTSDSADKALQAYLRSAYGLIGALVNQQIADRLFDEGANPLFSRRGHWSQWHRVRYLQQLLAYSLCGFVVSRPETWPVWVVIWH